MNFGDQWKGLVNPSSLFSMTGALNPLLAMLAPSQPAQQPPSPYVPRQKPAYFDDYEEPPSEPGHLVATGEMDAHGQPIYVMHHSHKHHRRSHQRQPSNEPVFNYQPANEKSDQDKRCSRFLSIRGKSSLTKHISNLSYHSYEGLFAEACGIIVDQRIPFEDMMLDSIKNIMHDITNRLNLMNRLAPAALKSALLEFARLFCQAMVY